MNTLASAQSARSALCARSDVRTLAILKLIAAVLLIIGVAGTLPTGRVDPVTITALGVVVGLLIATAIGLLLRQRWAWWAEMIQAAIACLVIPIGTLIGGFIIFALVRARPLFAPSPEVSDEPGAPGDRAPSHAAMIPAAIVHPGTLPPPATACAPTQHEIDARLRATRTHFRLIGAGLLAFAMLVGGAAAFAVSSPGSSEIAVGLGIYASLLALAAIALLCVQNWAPALALVLIIPLHFVGIGLILNVLLSGVVRANAQVRRLNAIRNAAAFSPA